MSPILSRNFLPPVVELPPIASAVREQRERDATLLVPQPCPTKTLRTTMENDIDAPTEGKKDELAGGPRRETMVYIGRKKCGCVVAAAVDDGRFLAATAEDVGEFIKRGYSVERVPLKDFTLTRCKCDKPANNQILPQEGRE